MKHVLSKINIGFIIELLNVYVKNNSINMTWHTSVSHVPLQIKNIGPLEVGKSFHNQPFFDALND